MTVIPAMVLLFNFLYQLCLCIGSIPYNIETDVLMVGTPKNFVLNSTVIYIIDLQNASKISERAPPRVFVKCDNCNENNPLLIVCSQNKGVLSWELPVVLQLDNSYNVYKNTERTLCPYDVINCSNSTLRHKKDQLLNVNAHTVTVMLSTSSIKNVLVELRVNLEENFILGLNVNTSVQVTPSTPAFYLYKFEQNNVTSVLLHVMSDDNICLLVSVQNVSCPVFDLQENIRFQGHFQTVTKQGGFTLTKEAFPNGFYVVLTVSSDDSYCAKTLVNSVFVRTKNVVLTLSKTMSSDEYFVVILSTLTVICLFCVTMFIIFICSMRREKTQLPELEDELMINDELEASASTHAPHNETSSVTPVTPVTPTAVTPGDTLSIKTDSSLDETDFDLVNDAESDKNVYRMKNFLYLCDLSRKNQSILKKKSDLYFSSILTVAIFYFLPVIQLVFTDQNNLNQSGNVDLCYYNFLCSHPLWWFSDFNHMFSNIGYISFGGLFMFLTVLKERDYRVKVCSNKKLYKFYGIPQHFGIFYAMGAALVIEGILSSCYHICPNHSNFQFDTSFMYVISTLCMIKIYQTRHPDINANASATFFLLAGVIVLGMYGVFSSNLTFWILFTIVHLSTCIHLSLQIYFMGSVKLEFISLVRWFKELHPCWRCDWKFFLPMFPSRFALLGVANICNWALAVGSFVYEIKNFSSYLLIIFMVNLVLYTAFYILMKFIYGEKLPLQSIVYILLAILCWSAALYFFFSKTISWRLTPAASKLYNEQCKLLDFYDNHDIWHFISAAAMFFSFMVLLTLDDNLIYVHRSKIVVF